MGENQTLNTINVILKIAFTLISGALRIVVQVALIIPKVLSRALTLLMKVGVIYKLLIDPALRSIGSFFAGLWRGAMQHRASSKIRKRRSDELKI